MRKFFICIYIILYSQSLYTQTQTQSVFDNVDWINDKQTNDILLSYYSNEEVMFFKAEKTFEQFELEKFADALLDFPNYSLIFPKTDRFEPFYKYDNNQYVMYTRLNFFPMKTRDAYIDMTYLYNENEFVLSWSPSIEYRDHSINSAVRAERVYGRWTVKKVNEKNTYVSVEYSNDWKIPNVPHGLLLNIQKGTTIDAINHLENYIRK